MESDCLTVRVDPKNLTYLKFILEGYDHLAILVVSDPKEGLIKLLYYKDLAPLVKEILEDLSSDLSIEIL